MRIYASIDWTIVGSDYGLSPARRQAIIWTNPGLSLRTFKNKKQQSSRRKDIFKIKCRRQHGRHSVSASMP